jgi:glycosyltransferase 2 family protein
MTTNAGHAQNRISRLANRSIGYLLALAGLAFVFHDIHLGRFLASLTNINWWWALAAIACDTLSYYCQGQRWRYLLRTRGQLSAVRATQAVYTGLFTNEILPLRAGELVRSYLAARWLDTGFLTILPSIAVERLFDGIWLALAIGLLAFIVPLPRQLWAGGYALGIVVLAGIALFLSFVLRNPSTAPGPVPNGSRPGVIGWIARATAALADELRAIGFSRNLVWSFLWSGLIFVFQACSFWLLMVACGLPLPLLAGAAVFFIVHLGTALPNAPSNIGTYQFFCVLGLLLYGIDKTTAAGFSVIVFVLLTIPLWLIGLVAFGQSGLTLALVRVEIARMMAAVKSKPRQ